MKSRNIYISCFLAVSAFFTTKSFCQSNDVAITPAAAKSEIATYNLNDDVIKKDEDSDHDSRLRQYEQYVQKKIARYQILRRPRPVHLLHLPISRG